MAKKARTSRPRRAAAPADGFAAPPQEMDIEEEEEPAPRRRAAPLVPLEHVIAKCPRAELEDLILASAKNDEPVTREEFDAAYPGGAGRRRRGHPAAAQRVRPRTPAYYL